MSEVVGLLSGDPRARVFAGATDLIPQVRSGRLQPSTAVDLKRVVRLRGVAASGGAFTVGAATPAVDIVGHSALSAAFPGLAEATGLIGSDQIQNRCTWGGNLGNASPAADVPPGLVVNGARAVIAGPSGERTVPVGGVVTGVGDTCLEPGEFIVEFELDEPPARTADAYLRMIPRTEMDIAIAGAAARVTLNADGAVSEAAIALAAVAPVVLRVPEAEAALLGVPVLNGASLGGVPPPSDAIAREALEAVEAAVASACNPINDKRGTAAYRRRVAGVLARRSVLIAAERAIARACSPAEVSGGGGL